MLYPLRPAPVTRAANATMSKSDPADFPAGTADIIIRWQTPQRNRADRTPASPSDIFLQHLIAIVTSVEEIHERGTAMIRKKLMTGKFLIGVVLGAMLSATLIAGCAGEANSNAERDPEHATLSRSAPEWESSSEHSGGEGSESSGDEEPSGGTNALAPEDTYDMVRNGARLTLRYDAPSNAFKGVVENTTNAVLANVRVEVHLSNGTELGPTPPTDMAPGEVTAINLPATAAAFTGWVAHAEVGGGESGGEHSSSDRESGGEHSDKD